MAAAGHAIADLVEEPTCEAIVPESDTRLGPERPGLGSSR
jgi:hypothetical protein